MKREYRLRKGSEFDSAFSKGTVIGGPLVILRVLPNEVGHVRWGFAVGKKIARKSTTRSRVKRLMREAARSSTLEMSSDVIVTARRDGLEATYQEFQAAIERGLRKAGVRTQ